MRSLIFIVLLFVITSAEAQTFIPGSFINSSYRVNAASNINFGDSAANKKWFFSKYSGLSTTFSFFKGGSATVVSAPMGLQLNRRLNNNVFAFAGLSAAPAFINFNSSFLNSGFNKSNANNSFKTSSLGIYSRAELGLMYVNDERTFSISGSIGVERNSFPMPAYYNSSNNYRLNQYPRQMP